MKKFLKKHGACEEGYKWAVKNCKTMQEVWDTAKPDWLIWVATREGVLTDRELHEFSLWAVEQVRHLMDDSRSIAAMDAKRAWLNGYITDAELAAARDAAMAAARAAEMDAARDAAWAAARAAARDAARAAAMYAAMAAARAAAMYAERDAAWDAASDEQAKWLRENTKPKFE